MPSTARTVALAVKKRPTLRLLVSVVALLLVFSLPCEAEREPHPSIQALSASKDYREQASKSRQVYESAQKQLEKNPAAREKVMKQVMDAQAAAVAKAEAAAAKSREAADAAQARMEAPDAHVEKGNAIVADTKDRVPVADRLKVHMGSKDCICAKQLYGALIQKKKMQAACRCPETRSALLRMGRTDPRMERIGHPGDMDRDWLPKETQHKNMETHTDDWGAEYGPDQYGGEPLPSTSSSVARTKEEEEALRRYTKDLVHDEQNKYVPPKKSPAPRSGASSSFAVPSMLVVLLLAAQSFVC